MMRRDALLLEFDQPQRVAKVHLRLFSDLLFRRRQSGFQYIQELFVLIRAGTLLHAADHSVIRGMRPAAGRLKSLPAAGQHDANLRGLRSCGFEKYGALLGNVRAALRGIHPLLIEGNESELPVCAANDVSIIEQDFDGTGENGIDRRGDNPRLDLARLLDLLRSRRRRGAELHRWYHATTQSTESEHSNTDLHSYTPCCYDRGDARLHQLATLGRRRPQTQGCLDDEPLETVPKPPFALPGRRQVTHVSGRIMGTIRPGRTPFEGWRARLDSNQ
jgi:hypothetical protein